MRNDHDLDKVKSTVSYDEMSELLRTGTLEGQEDIATKYMVDNADHAFDGMSILNEAIDVLFAYRDSIVEVSGSKDIEMHKAAGAQVSALINELIANRQADVHSVVVIAIEMLAQATTELQIHAFDLLTRLVNATPDPSAVRKP